MIIKKPLNIAILGAGSIGCYLGGCLTEAGVDVTFIGRKRIQQQLLTHGLTLTDWQGRSNHIQPDLLDYSLSINTLIISKLSIADYILVTVKSGDTQSVIDNIAEHANPNAIIVSFQNGIRNGDLLKEGLPNYQILTGMVPFNVLAKGEGKFHCGTEGNLAIEDKKGLATSLITAFEEAKLSVDVYDDLKPVQWSKLILNLNNSINALSGLPLKTQLSDRTYRKVLALSMKEALRILHSANIKTVKTGKVVVQLIPYILLLPNSLFKIIASPMIKIDPMARSSMYEDFVLHRQTEIDYLNGEIVALAEQQNIPCPINSAIVQLIKHAEEMDKGSPQITAKTLLNYITH